MAEVNLLPKDRVAKRGIIEWLADRRRGTHTVGIDIQRGAIRVCHAHRTAHGARIVQVHEALLPPDAIAEDGTFMRRDIIADALTDLRGQCRVGGMPERARAVIGVRGHSVITKRIAIPTMTEAELRESIPWEAEQYIPFDINDVHLDVEIIGAVTALHGEMQVMLVAVRREVLDDSVDVCEEGGFHVCAVESSQWAQRRAAPVGANPVVPMPTETTAYADVGSGSIAIAIVGSDRAFAFTRDISMGIDLLIEEIRVHHAVSYDTVRGWLIAYCEDGAHGVPIPEIPGVEATVQTVINTIAGELQRAFDFYQATTADATLARIVLSGSGADVPELEPTIATLAALSVSRLQVAGVATAVPTDRHARYALAIGHALRVASARGVVTHGAVPAANAHHGHAHHHAVPHAAPAPPEPKRYRVSRAELSRVCLELGFLLGQGVLIFDAFDAMIADGTVKPKLQDALRIVRGRIAEGQSFADAMAAALDMPPAILLAIRSGEATGDISGTLHQCGMHLKIT